jgi:hypothetical protein
MGHYPNQQIGWSQESILLQRIIKQLVRINKLAGGGKPATTTTTTT